MIKMIKPIVSRYIIYFNKNEITFPLVTESCMNDWTNFANDFLLCLLFSESSRKKINKDGKINLHAGETEGHS